MVDIWRIIGNLEREQGCAPVRKIHARARKRGATKEQVDEYIEYAREGANLYAPKQECLVRLDHPEPASLIKFRKRIGLDD